MFTWHTELEPARAAAAQDGTILLSFFWAPG